MLTTVYVQNRSNILQQQKSLDLDSWSGAFFARLKLLDKIQQTFLHPFDQKLSFFTQKHHAGQSWYSRQKKTDGQQV